MTISQLKTRPMRLASARKRDVRTQFGALCWRIRKDKVQVLLVTSRGTGRWVVPKGWPMDGETPADTAAIEAWEEAGVEGAVRDSCLGIFTYLKVMDGDDLPCVVAVFPIKVTKSHDTWPESKQRRRRWTSPKKAARLVAEPELARLLLDFDPRRLRR
ncbi:NUDIX hydrolase [Profundibacterium mesophilum]|uniref:Bis-tetraphosphatase n=1 Tax=Profundibacterium mesophilum KAUST100406-0324 TaxID=1037889 RepID=A0A921NUQ2_9RHOB|nr:NUDIX hydrolase [Profundibacterium mesophilum]KAF0677014.1 bis-tetraphosphatase [Profundibacterium mesophilum KAUST100406-0324]